MIAIIAIGILMKNNQCHVANSKIAPPNKGPTILEIPKLYIKISFIDIFFIWKMESNEH